MQSEGCVDVAEAAGRTPRLADFYRMKLALDIAAPEFEKAVQLGKIGGSVELLPDEALQQVGMIGKMVDDFRRGQPIFRRLHAGLAHTGSPRQLALANREP